MKTHNKKLEQIWLCHDSCMRNNTRHLTPNSSTWRYVPLWGGLQIIKLKSKEVKLKRMKKNKLKLLMILISFNLIISCGTINEIVGSLKTGVNNINDKVENNSVNSLTEKMINDGWSINELDTARKC